MMESAAVGNAALADELRRVVDRAEQLLGATGGEDDEALSALRERVLFTMDTARMRLAEMEDQANAATQRFALTVESYMRAHPWAAVAVGAGVGLMAGVLLARLATSRGEDTDSQTQAAHQ